MTRWHFNYALLFAFSMNQILSSFNLLMMTLTFCSLIQISAGTNSAKNDIACGERVSETWKTQAGCSLISKQFCSNL